MSKLTDEQIDEGLRLAEAASAGPWFRDSCELCTGVSQGTSYRDRGVFITDETTYDDAAFIAAARTLLPSALNELKAIRQRGSP